MIKTVPAALGQQENNRTTIKGIVLPVIKGFSYVRFKTLNPSKLLNLLNEKYLSIVCKMDENFIEKRGKGRVFRAEKEGWLSAIRYVERLIINLTEGE